jgi:AcrR family transcriptional regulator
VTTAIPARAQRGRRSTRPSGDEREQAILTTAERLLADRPLSDISVDDLAKGAGLSRPTFYFYFPSKDAVLVRLFERVVVEADSTMLSRADEPSEDLSRSWRDGIRTFMASFRTHRAVTLAAMAARPTSSELQQLWSTFMDKWVAHIAELIEAERARGAAPVTIAAQDMSAALHLMNERVVIAALTGESPGMPEETALDTLAHVWVTTIYGRIP